MLEQLRARLADRYTVEREIGSGGMAYVFLAQDIKHHRPVAIKVLRPELTGALGPDRFLREIEIAAQLSHPHILPLHDSGDADGILYYVMPYVDGESLRDRLKRAKRLPVPEAVRIANEVADALEYAHSRGVVHRDIKPENILLSAGHAVVSDFGIARAISAAGGERLTATGIALGTLQYMSPEQAFGDRAVDGRSDVYSLGCVLHEMLGGAPTRRFSAGGDSATDPEIPKDLVETLTKATAPDPADRFSSAAHFASALSRTGASPTVAAARRRGRIAVVAAAAAALAVVVWGLGRTRGDASGALTANRLAVLPFAIHGGQQLAYMSEGIVDLLSRNLDGVDDLNCVDPGTVISELADGTDNQAVDVESGRALGKRVGAGAFILGSVNSVGPRLRIHAVMYRDGGSNSDVQATVEGDTAQLLDLVDRLAADLLVKRRPGAVHRLTQTAALTTSSLPALKAFLTGERTLRAGKMDSAIAAYQHAIAEDSTFALAYYRMAVAAGWNERHAFSSEAIAKALAVPSRLAERDRRLMTAYAAFRRGAATEAEGQYREILEDFPDDLEAEFQLGDVLFQYNPLRGRPRGEARPMLDRTLAHDPGFL